MSTQSLIRRFAYNAWANREALRSVRDANGSGPLPDRAEAIVAHLVGAELLWYGRIGQDDEVSARLVWPTYTLDESEAHLVGLARSWPGMLDAYLPDRLDRAVTYINSRGETFTSTAGDIFEHILLHAHYHRGQLASLLGRAGRKAAVTDFIAWVHCGEPGPG